MVQLLQGHKDLEMTGEIGLVNHQEIKVVIPEWWTWWKWLVLLPTAWKASHEGLKVLTLVPNPIRKSLQTQVTCGYSCISITTCPCINTSYTLWLCLVVCLLIVIGWNLFVCFCNLSFISFCWFWSIFFLLLCQKSKNLIKSRKSKSLIDTVEFLSQNLFCLVPLC